MIQLSQSVRRIMKSTVAATVLMLGVDSSAHAAWTASVTGTVMELRNFAPDTNSQIWFSLSSMPATGCVNSSEFAISSVTIADPEVVKRMYTTLLVAKVAGLAVTVGYDSGASCDGQFPRVYEVVLAS